MTKRPCEPNPSAEEIISSMRVYCRELSLSLSQLLKRIGKDKYQARKALLKAQAQYILLRESMRKLSQEGRL